jgi:sugar lactone lactonase YvrE
MVQATDRQQLNLVRRALFKQQKNKVMKNIKLFLSLAALIFCLPVQGQIIYTIAGDTAFGYNGDNLPATATHFAGTTGVAIDNSGNMYISDYDNNRVRKINTAGIVTTIAGTGTAGFSGNGGPATAANIKAPLGLAADNAGNIYFCDLWNNCVRKIDASGIITAFAGDTGIAAYSFSGDGGPATAAAFRHPAFIAIDRSNNVYITDAGNNRVRKVDPTGVITTFAGGDTVNIGDGGPATNAMLPSPAGITIDNSGNIYVATSSSQSRVRKIDPAGIITTIAGPGPGSAGINIGDGGPATGAIFNSPEGVATDAAGNVYVADTYHGRIRKISTTGTISTVAGNGHCCYSGDGGYATFARIGDPTGLAFDRTGNLVFTDGYTTVRGVRYALSVDALNATSPEFSLFPNPCNGSFTIRGSLPPVAPILITVLDIAGTKVLETTREPGAPLTIDISGLPPGIYFVITTTPGITKSEKIVVKP